MRIKLTSQLFCIFSKIFGEDFIISIPGSLKLSVPKSFLMFCLNFQKAFKTDITNIIGNQLPERLTCTGT